METTIVIDFFRTQRYKCTVRTCARLILGLGIIGDGVAVPTRVPTVRRGTRVLSSIMDSTLVLKSPLKC